MDRAEQNNVNTHSYSTKALSRWFQEIKTMKMTIDKDREFEQKICPYALLLSITTATEYMEEIDKNYRRFCGIDGDTISLFQSASNLVSFVGRQNYSAGYS